MLFEPDAERFTLIHGRISQINHDDYLIGHAWIELYDGRVYDPVLNKYMPSDEYAKLRRSVIERRYTKSEAMRISAMAGHYGPWH
jgi:hypothetical protein